MVRIVKLMVVFLQAFFILSCAGGRKLAVLEKNGITAAVAAGSLEDVAPVESSGGKSGGPQVVEVQDLQGKSIIMNAVLDEESGEMVASEQLQEIVVEARFRHVAERNGQVDLVFELSVPVQLQERVWQIRFTPEYRFLGDTLISDRVFVTGKKFRKVQQWEYFMYNNYMGRLVQEEDVMEKFGRERQKKVFLSRFGEGKSDEASAHYRKHLLEGINRGKLAAGERIFSRFVVDPYPSGGIRLDSVVADNSSEAVRYHYVQGIRTRAGLKKVEMVLKGEVYTNGKKLCNLAAAGPVTFYISSISSFTDPSERYLKKVVSRDLHLSTLYDIGFAKGRWNVDPSLGGNALELAAIRRNIAEILENDDFVMDSLLITAACSPEGKLHVNEKLSGQRGNAIREYVLEYVEAYRDSVEAGVWEINEDKGYREDAAEFEFDGNSIAITEVSEDWDQLHALIEADTVLQGKGRLLGYWKIADPDTRERELVKGSQGEYIREELYPKLRSVKFNFKLHRKGMLKDTVHTTELDTAYMNGVEALLERDYKRAVTLLRPYNCYNTAVAYVCMDYNASALEVLNTLPRDARRDYMLAVVHSRLGDERLAVEYYLASVQQDGSMRHRGNLDPEISALIKKYGIFNNQ